MPAIVKTLKPLGWLGMWLYPWLKLIRRGTRLQLLERRQSLTLRQRVQRATVRELKKDIDKEAKTIGNLLIDKLDYLGYNYQFKDGRTSRIQFERIKANDQILHYKVLTRARGPFGIGVIQTLPYKVRIGNIIAVETLQELSWTVERVVTAVYEDPRSGVWIRVHRQESIGGLPSKVTFKSLLEYWPADTSGAPMLLGIGEHKRPHIISLADDPHVLIGGATRSGKSNIVNNIIAGLMRHTHPDELQFILIDLKRVEFNFYKNAPHLFQPVIMEAAKAEEALQTVLDELHARMEKMEGSETKELAQWNQLHQDDGLKMPRLIVVIDEFAELVMASGKETREKVIDLVKRIANLGRAAGIHLIVATQRPATSVIDNAIKINMPLVLAGRVQNMHQSGVILGNGLAATLPRVPGRMIYQSGAEQYTIQTPYISNEDIRECIRIARGRQVGVIDVDGIDPLINVQGLTRWLLRENDGVLAFEGLRDRLSNLAIAQQMFKAYREDLVKAGQVTVDDKLYKVVPGNNTYHLDPVSEPTETELSGNSETESGRRLETVMRSGSPEQPTLTVVRSPQQELALQTWHKIRADKQKESQVG